MLPQIPRRHLWRLIHRNLPPAEGIAGSIKVLQVQRELLLPARSQRRVGLCAQKSAAARREVAVFRWLRPVQQNQLRF